MEPRRIGEVLIQRGWITGAQLEEGLSSQVVNGARLGTNLVELGYLGIDRLARALAFQHGVPVAEPAAFMDVSRQTLALVPRTLCSRYGVFPLHYELPSRLHLAMIDPHRLELIDELGAILSVLEIQPYAAPELRLFHFLELCHEVPRPKRLLRAQSRRDGLPKPEDERRHYLRPTIEDGPAGARASQQLLQLGGDDFVISAEGFDERIPVEEALERLARAPDRDAVIEVLLQPLLRGLDLVVLFLVRGEMAVAEGAWGTRLSRNEVRSLVVPATQSELTRWVIDERAPLRGDTADDPVQQMIATFLGTPVPAEVCLAPICLDEKTVNVLCLHTSTGFEDDALAELARIAREAGAAYERLMQSEMAPQPAVAAPAQPTPTPTPGPAVSLEDSFPETLPVSPEPVGEVGSRVARQIRLLPRARRRFGRYELICRLASGGVANLYLARLSGRAGFEKDVAIKRIHEHLSHNAEFIQMFIDEARLAARIEHANVGQVIDFDCVEGSFYIAMEYVHGESLHALMERARPKPALTARIIAHAAAGLHAAHELADASGEPLGVVHRDVSPQNILISYRGAVKVVDFGVAQARGNLHQDSSPLKGKLAYMSPEQVQSRHLDRRADIFSLGVILHEATTFQSLLKADTPQATMRRVVEGEIPPPSSVRPDYPAELEAIVMRALERDPGRRFQTAEELQAALETFIVRSESLVLASALGKLMQTTFADRIAEKKQVLEERERERAFAG